MPLATRRPAPPPVRRPAASKPPTRQPAVRAHVLDVPFELRGVPQAHGAPWDAAAKAYIFRGERLPDALIPYRCQPHSWERFKEDEINGGAAVASPPSREVKLRPHQIEAAAAVKAALKAGRSGFLIADDVGLGKTMETWASILAMPDADTVLIVCPLAVVAHWRRTIEWMGDGGKRVVVINYDRLKKLFEVSPEAVAKMAARRRRKGRRIQTGKGVARHGEAAEFDVVVWDEAHKCFPYDTPIPTDQGNLPIGEIVEQRLPVYVLSWNPETGKTSYLPITGWFDNPSEGRFIDIHHETGTLRLTPDHPVWILGYGLTPARVLTELHDRPGLRALWAATAGDGRSPEHRELLFTAARLRNGALRRSHDTLPVVRDTVRFREGHKQKPPMLARLSLGSQEVHGASAISGGDGMHLLRDLVLVPEEDGQSSSVLTGVQNPSGHAAKDGGEGLCQLQRVLPDPHKGEGNREVLQPKLLQSNRVETTSESPRGNECSVYKAEGHFKLLTLSGALRARAHQEEAILLDQLRQHQSERLPLRSAGVRSEDEGPLRGECTSLQGQEDAPAFRTDEGKQSDEDAGCDRENLQGHARENLPRPRGQWTTHEAPDASGADDWPGSGLHGACHQRAPEGNAGSRVQESSDALQGGYLDARHEGLRGGGRGQPSNEALEILGSTEDGDARPLRVVGHSLHERADPGGAGEGSCRGDRVYSIEVAPYHVHFADGVLVSNCRNPESARAKMSAKISAEADFILWLSATAGQNPLELSYLAPLLAESTGSRASQLKDYVAWCKDQGIGVIKGAYGKVQWRGASPDEKVRDGSDQDLEKIRGILFGGRIPSGIRRSPTDIAGWPEINRILLPIEMEGEDRRLYDEAWNEFRRQMELARAGGKDSKNALVVRLRFRQKASLLRTAATLDLALELLEQGQQVAISVAFMETLEVLREALEKAGVRVAVIHGKIGAAEKEAQRLDFQHGRRTACLFTVEDGISLHQGEYNEAKRSNILHDIRWSAIQMKQIEGRTHRDGKFSQVYWMVGEGTVEEDIARVVVGRIASMGKMQGDAETIDEIERMLMSMRSPS